MGAICPHCGVDSPYRPEDHKENCPTRHLDWYDNKVGVYVGRFCPVHRGHMLVINQMVKNHGIENILIVLGSASSPLTIRNMFTYVERRDFIKRLYPGIPLVPLGDQRSDVDWNTSLFDIVQIFSLGRQVIFYTGSNSDITNFYLNNDTDVEIIDRFIDPSISATEIRFRLIRGLPVDDLVDHRIYFNIEEIFHTRWNEIASS